MTGSAHVPRAGSLPKRFGSSRSGPPPLLRCAGHPASSAGIHGCVQRPSTATVAPGAVWWGAVWSEVKEEGRMDSREALESTTGPGDMNATRHPAAPLSRRLSTDDLCPRMTAKGRKRTLKRLASFPVQDAAAWAFRRRMCSSRICFSSTALGAPVNRHCARCVFGKAITSRMLSALVISVTRRSRPKARPP